MIKAIFAASTYNAGVYWAKQWGYKLREVLIVTPQRAEQAYGLRGDSLPVFLCGPTITHYAQERRMWDVIYGLQQSGLRIFDGQQIGGEMRPVLVDL